jgi:flagellar basal-body rod modification protein FlgD
MTTIDPTSAAQVAAATTPAQSASSSATNAVNKDTFLKLLVAQLKYQNPMSPTDSTQFLQQTATFTQVENLQDILARTTDLLAAQKTTQATGMLGQQITATGSDGKDITGIVTGMKLTANGPSLHVNGTDVDISSVTEVDRPAATTPSAGTTPTTNS